MVADAQKAPRAMYLSLKRLLLVAITLCAFYSTTFARVVATPRQPEPDAGALINSTSLDKDEVLESGSLSTVSTNKHDLHTVSIGKRQAAVTEQEAFQVGQSLLAERDQYLSKQKTFSSSHHKMESYNQAEINEQYAPPAILRPSLMEDGIAVANNWLYSHIRGPHLVAVYKNSYFYDQHAAAGVIIGEDNIRFDRDNSISWAEATYWEYVMKANGDTQRLKYIYQVTISNKDTKSFIKGAIQSQEYVEHRVVEGCQHWYVFVPGSHWFTVLLGSNNGRGAGALTSKFVRYIGLGYVSQIHVHYDPGYENYAMKIVLARD